MQIIAVMRQGKMLLPASDPTMQAGDQVLVMTSHQAWEQLSPHLASVSSS